MVRRRLLSPVLIKPPVLKVGPLGGLDEGELQLTIACKNAPVDVVLMVRDIHSPNRKIGTGGAWRCPSQASYAIDQSMLQEAELD